jgi:ADP-ribosyl-[dinitrogen reductase] hydrolase
MSVLDLKNKTQDLATTHRALLDKAQGAYLGLAIGDALGATVEFMTPSEIQSQFGEHRTIQGGGWLKLKPGQVTDDTTMSLAMGEAILAKSEVEASSIAEAFSQWMSAKPVDIGHTVRRGIVQYRLKGTTQMPANDYDGGNGACMRTLPIALVTWGAQLEVVQTASRIQAHITHHNQLSDAGTQCIIRMIHCALGGGSLSDLEALAWQLVEEQPQFLFDRKRRVNPSGFIVETLQAVLQALFDYDNFEQAMIDVVNRGGDADTTGAILGMVAGALYGVSAIPMQWRSRLDGQIAEVCRQQAQTLLRLSPGFLEQNS